MGYMNTTTTNADPNTPLAERLRSLKADNALLLDALSFAAPLIGGWREAIVELEDHCSDPVRLKNMIAAADQLDEFRKRLHGAIAAVEPSAAEQSASV